ncbi:PTS sugar transporter subunit IIA [candidate division KSB1 bacterium]|nr:PTS sugar transporter subunit IIA [candidate division KSB1 bacterium]RQW09640.1 MAG: PTS sugar transporter subunit IIA [candidate division KSB1 bacterium]
MSLLDILTKDVIAVPLVSSDKSGAIMELIQLFKKSGVIANENEVYDAIMLREAKGSTGLAKGIAVPHAKTLAVKKIAAAIGISPAGIEFGSLDGLPSKLIFLIIAPPDQTGPHVALLSEIARLTQHQELCDELVAARNADRVIAILQGEE